MHINQGYQSKISLILKRLLSTYPTIYLFIQTNLIPLKFSDPKSPFISTSMVNLKTNVQKQGLQVLCTLHVYRPTVLGSGLTEVAFQPGSPEVRGR